jgi:hypothetical protein
MLSAGLLCVPLVLTAQERLVLGSAGPEEEQKIAQELRQDLERVGQVQAMYQQQAALLYKDRKIKTLSREEQEPIILHLKGEHGVEFQEPTIPDIDPQALKEIEKLTREKVKEMMANYKKEATAKQSFPACLKDETILISQMKKNDPKRANRKELLFISEALKPDEDDKSEPFGQGVKVKVFPNQVYKEYLGLVAPFGFSCLPFRVHLGARGLEMLRGEIALRNYDENPKGELDRTIKLKWEDFKRRARMDDMSGAVE